MQLHPAIFKAYDIRGTTPATLDEGVAEALGLAFGTRALALGERVEKREVEALRRDDARGRGERVRRERRGREDAAGHGRRPRARPERPGGGRVQREGGDVQ